LHGGSHAVCRFGTHDDLIGKAADALGLEAQDLLKSYDAAPTDATSRADADAWTTTRQSLLRRLIVSSVLNKLFTALSSK
jgi:hypothetical protein